MGAEIRESMKTRAWEDAERDLAEMKNRPSLKSEAPRTVQDAVDRYMVDVKSRNLRPVVVGKYSHFFKVLVAFADRIGKKYVSQLTFDDMSLFRSEWPDSPQSSTNKLSKLRSFFRHAMSAGWIKQNPAIGIRSPRIPDNPTMPFTQAEMTAILAACDSYPEPERQALRSFVLALRYTGLRIGDATSLNAVRVANGRVLLHQQKTGELVYVPIPSFVENAIVLMGGGEYFFWDGLIKLECVADKWRRRLRTLFSKAGVKNGRPHRFRDTFAVELLLAGVPIEDVSILLGHKSIKTTERSYAPWVRARQQRMENHVRQAWGDLESREGTKSVR